MKRFCLFILLIILDFTISATQADNEIEKLKTELTLDREDTAKIRLWLSCPLDTEISPSWFKNVRR